ncbi:MAG: hypothetical protein ACR2MB_07530 [Acidimicrobiales bacterium]
MLAATDLLVLGEQMAPPPGFEVDAIVAATYSLELPMALALPLSVIRQGRFAGETAESADRFATLEAIRRLAAQYRVFHDATALLPTGNQRLLSLLHRVCIPVQVPSPDRRITSFHPKFVLVRFRRERAPGRLRLLCMSRNLTGSAALDVTVVLDGDIEEGPTGDASSERLAHALRQLPAWSRHPDDDGTTAALVEDLGRTVEQTRWRVPAKFARMEIWPLGFGGHGADPVLPQEHESRTLVMSPFLDIGRIRALGRNGPENVLISEQREIDALPATALAPFARRAFTMRESAGGLHAKLFVHETVQRVRWVIGSANATTAAATRNAEMVVELEGARRAYGIDLLLDDDVGVGRLLSAADTEGGGDDVDRSSPSEEAFRALSGSTLEAIVEPDAGAGHTVTVRAQPPIPTEGPRVRVGFPGTAAAALMAPDAVMRGVPRARLSRWLVVEVTANGDAPHSRLLAVKLVGVDLDQVAEDAVTDLVADAADPLSFLRDALSGATPEAVGLRFDDAGPPPEPESDSHGGPASASATSTLLEPLLAKLEGDRGAVGDDTIAQDLAVFVETMKSRLPADFLELWNIVHEARRAGGAG